MSYTEQDVERVAEAIWHEDYFWNTGVYPDHEDDNHTSITWDRESKATQRWGRSVARAALEAMGREPLEDVLRVKNWKVTLAHSHTSDGEALDDAWFAYVVDWHTGKHLAHENGATIDEAIRNAIAAAKGEKT